MKCAEFEDRLNEVLDQRSRPAWDPALRLHCDTCPQCRELAARYDVLLDGFYALTTPELPADLSTRVLDEFRVQPSFARRASLAAAGLFATAAAVWFLVIPLAQTERPGQLIPLPDRSVALHTAPATPPIAKPLAWDQVDDLPVVGPMLVSMSDQANDPYAALAKGTGQGLASVVLYMPTIGGSPGMIGGGAHPITGQPAWPERMSDGLKPVTDVVAETLGLLLQVLPDGTAKRS